MRTNIKSFLIGALIAVAPMSYLVAKSIPQEQKTTENKDTESNVVVDSFLWSKKLTENPKKESEALAGKEACDIFFKDTPSGKTSSPGSFIPECRDSGNSETGLKVLASTQVVSIWTFTTTHAPTVTPTIAPKPTNKPKPKPKTQIAVAVQIPAAPTDVGVLIERYATEYGVNKDMMIGIAKCESGFRANAVNGPYAGIYQFVSSTWVSNRKAMGLNPDPTLRYNMEESIKTAAFKMSRDGFGAWPVCQSKARKLVSL